MMNINGGFFQCGWRVRCSFCENVGHHVGHTDTSPVAVASQLPHSRVNDILVFLLRKKKEKRKRKIC
jgi:hypothetical protein